MASIFQNALAAQDYGYDKARQFMGDRARATAGNALAAGSPQQAANALYRAGELDAGEAILQRDEGRQMSATARQSEADQQRREQEAQVIKLRGQTMIQGARALQQVPMGERSAYLQQRIVPMFSKLGLDTSVFQGLSEDDLSDQSLSMFADSVDQELKILNLGEGYGVAVDPRTGRQVAEYKAPTPDKYEAVDPTKDLIRIPGDPGTSGIGGGSGPRNMRNNNPGNIEDGPFARSLPGYKGSDGRFAIFDSPEAGTQAQVRLLQSYGQRGLNTVQGIIGRWAPASDGNDVAGYSRFVAEKLGVKPDTPLNMQDPRTLSALAGAIQQFEGGPASASNDRQPQVVRAGTPDRSKEFARERQLRTEFGGLPEVKDFASVRPYVQTIGRIATKARDGGTVTAADDMALIFSYMKMLDPGSVVREGEFANAQNTAGIPDRIVNTYNRALRGTRLSDKQRAEFFQAASDVMQSFTSNYNDRVGQYRGLAEEYGMDPDRIAREGRRAQPPADAVAYLRQNPQLAQDFDAKYGRGAAARILGTN